MPYSLSVNTGILNESRSIPSSTFGKSWIKCSDCAWLNVAITTGKGKPESRIGTIFASVERRDNWQAERSNATQCVPVP